MREQNTRLANLSEAPIQILREGVVFVASQIVTDPRKNVNEKPNNGIEVASEENGSYVYVPEEVRRAGALLREARTIHHVSASDISADLHDSLLKSYYFFDSNKDQINIPFSSEDKT